ncbi:prepilin-type N-terminal cleavage/methylation domain-containing protein [Candidatus Saccharibacteria bacterium]|nr:prepilin-type N-terminal cleavage/methylation domain-containing protein [Candidatus Saccharibacteria bacterium]
MTTQTKNRGFTIVELLIVIVVIAILAAITIVAYNGIQNRARTSASQSAANIVVKKAEAANSLASAYPQNAAAFAANSESNLTGSGITLVTSITAAPANPNTAVYTPCTGTAGTGAVIRYWDYQANALATPISIGNPTAATTCVAGTAITGTY